MITCLDCRHTAPEGTLFCSECGAPLSEASLQWMESQHANFSKSLPPGLADAETAELSGPAPVVLLVLQGQELRLPDLAQCVLGRSGPHQALLPDVDLGPYQGFELGISRLHLILRRRDRNLFAADLSSANGSALNGKRLAPYQEHLIHDGDILTLGKLTLQVKFEAGS